MAFEEFHNALPPNSTNEWRKAVELWEADPAQTNPFAATAPCEYCSVPSMTHVALSNLHTFITAVTQASVRLQLAEEEQARITAGEAFLAHTDMSASTMINVGLELEEQQ